MSEEMKMSDVFDLPLKRAVNELAIIDRDDRVVGWADAFSGEVARDCIVESINNHDRLTEENRKLREALSDLVDASSGNEQQLNELLMCSDYGESQSLCKARQLLEELK